MDDSRRLKALGSVLAKALRVSDSGSEHSRLSASTLFCAFVILVLVSFTMLWLGDKLNASGMALTRFMASGQAPVTAQLGYPQTGRDQIAVFLYDQEFLRENKTAWPLSYQDHADWLLHLAGQAGARPKAIFLDLTFGQEHRDPTLPALVEAICTLRNTYGVPVFIAALPSPENGKLTVRSGLGGDAACFTAVGVDYTPDPLDRFAWTYPLTRHFTPKGWVDGPAPAPSSPAYRSVAMTIAQDVAKINLGEETVPMALAWGHDADPGAPPVEDFAGCVPTRPWGDNLVPAVFRQLYDSDRPRLCPYHSTLSMARVGEMSEQDIAARVKDRYVMLGARIPGHNDFVTSPVHDLLPGVYYHAMALDNFLSYQNRYKLNHEWNTTGLQILVWPGLLTVAVVLVVRWLILFLANRLGKYPSRVSAWCARRAGLAVKEGRLFPCDWIRLMLLSGLVPATSRLTSLVAAGNSVSLRGRVQTLLLNRLIRMQRGLTAAARDSKESWYDRIAISMTGALAWAFRVLLQFVAAMAMIALLQTLFRVGMLPVVELVSMTLLAEGIGYLGKLRWFFLGNETPCPRCA